MSLTPQDIQAKQFHVRFRGFDVEEVDGFLEEVAENFLMLIEEKKALQLKTDAFEQELENLKKEEHSFKNAMISAQNVADQMVKKSREDADYILNQAHDEVKKLKDEALKEISELEYQVDQLRGTQGELQKDLRAVIDDYLDMIDHTSSITINSEDKSIDDDQEEELTTSSMLSNDQEEELITSSMLSDDLEDELKTSSSLSEAQQEEEEVSTSSALSDSEVDLSDLYEKIDLPSEHPAAENYTEDALPVADVETVEFESKPVESESIEIEASIPDLDDDIMFTLEDPLDELKPEEDKS